MSRQSRGDAVRRDIRHGFRMVRHAPGFAGWLVGSLAIGMAVTIAAFAFLNAVLLLPFPAVTDQHRLVRIALSSNCGGPDCGTRLSSADDYAALQDGLTTVEAVAAYTFGELAVALPDARSVRGVLTSPNYFQVLGVRPALGRVFNAADAAGHAPVVVISHALWAREFGARDDVLGRSIRVADRFVSIVGVAPALFNGINRTGPGERTPDVWLPMWMGDAVFPFTTTERRRGARDYAFVGRLRPGVDVSDVHVEATVLSRRLGATRGDASAPSMVEVRRVWRVDPRSWHFGIIVVMPIPLLVLAIACINAANLLLARGSQRRREIAIRAAIGASRGRIIAQLVIENAVLTLLATVAALPIAWWGLQLASVPLNVPIPFDPAVLALSVATAAATTIAFGLAPAVRVSAQQPSATLGGGGARTDATPAQSRTRRVLVVAQVALSLGVLATAWQLVTTVRAQAVSGGAPGNRLLIARFDLQPLNFSSQQVDRFYADLLAAASRLSAVESAGIAPHTGVWTFGHRAQPDSLTVWHGTDKPEQGRAAGGGYAEGRLFDAVGLRVLAGRDFTEADRHPRARVAIVNRTFAEGMNEPAVGSTIRVAPRGHDVGAAIEVRIVGVIEAAVEPRLDASGSPPANVYLPAPIEPTPALAVYMRTRDDAAAVAQPFRELVSRIAPRVPISEIASLDEMNERSYSLQLWLARAAAFLGIVGLLLAALGLYGISSYAVTMRSRELAIRLAIGASPRAILAMILGQSLRMAFAGLLFGALAAFAASRWIQSEYHGIVGVDRVAFAGAALLFLAAMAVAGALPARRASRIDPLENLRDA